ncbi:MAG: 30S ribosomal protein S6 [Candidatus Brocadiaceae bacterium]|nr:30S ribosomal protein S6 [Candidatus Brocadiaceae bacterium]
MYEGLFLIDNTHASAEWDTVVRHIHEILQKSGAEILKTENWGEKKLAYKVEGHKRGTYLLIHFNAQKSSIATIKRDCLLSDYILRYLILKDDKIEVLAQQNEVEEAVVPENTVGEVPEEQDAEFSEEENVPA